MFPNVDIIFGMEYNKLLGLTTIYAKTRALLHLNFTKYGLKLALMKGNSHFAQFGSNYSSCQGKNRQLVFVRRSTIGWLEPTTLGN